MEKNIFRIIRWIMKSLQRSRDNVKTLNMKIYDLIQHSFPLHESYVYILQCTYAKRKAFSWSINKNIVCMLISSDL